MGRPAKSTNTKTGTILKEEEKHRKETEERLKGNDDELSPPSHLTESQRIIFNYIIKNLKESKILGNLDIYILTQASIDIDRLQDIEMSINEDPSLLYDSKFMATKEKYSKDFFRCCNELCLSPQARAKLSISSLPKKEEKKTLADILGDDEDD